MAGVFSDSVLGVDVSFYFLLFNYYFLIPFTSEVKSESTIIFGSGIAMFLIYGLFKSSN